MSRLFIYSVGTLASLSLLLAIVLFAAILFIVPEGINSFVIFGIAAAITILFNLVILFVAPWIQDFIYRFIYKVKWYNSEEFAAAYPQVASSASAITTKYKFKLPKFGVIPDQNPQAFCYGSTQSNGRVVFTDGLVTYLAPDELDAVIAHELGHIYNRDFIVMTIASTMLQLIYEASRILSRVKSDKGKNATAVIAVVTYVFYVIGQYLLLFLSRTREYMADKFAAENTNPDALVRALFKVSYGIVNNPEGSKSSGLLESTRALGIVDIKSAENTAVVGKQIGVSEQKPVDYAKFFKYMVFDLKSPWAFISELNSTHPLTAKRIKNLLHSANPTFIQQLTNYINGLNINTTKLYIWFALDFTVQYAPFIIVLISLPLLFIGISPVYLISLFGLVMITQAIYSYPYANFAPATVAELMQDVYASPVRGRPVLLEGKIVGRGNAGNIINEDMMVEDSTGLVFVDVRTFFGFLSNIIFALSKFKKMIGQSGQVQAYFFRGVANWTVLAKFSNSEHTVNSYPKLWSIIIGTVLFVVGLVATAALYLVK